MPVVSVTPEHNTVKWNQTVKGNYYDPIKSRPERKLDVCVCTHMYVVSVTLLFVLMCPRDAGSLFPVLGE